MQFLKTLNGAFLFRGMPRIADPLIQNAPTGRIERPISLFFNGLPISPGSGSKFQPVERFQAQNPDFCTGERGGVQFLDAPPDEPLMAYARFAQKNREKP